MNTRIQVQEGVVEQPIPRLYLIRLVGNPNFALRLEISRCLTPENSKE